MTFQVVLDRGRLTAAELATLYGVSRQTIHTWSKGGQPRPGTYTARMANTITRAITAAIEKKLLPLPDMAKPARAARVTAMAKILQAVKPAAPR